MSRLAKRIDECLGTKGKDEEMEASEELKQHQQHWQTENKPGQGSSHKIQAADIQLSNKDEFCTFP